MLMLKIMYLLNRRIKVQSENVFEGISRGRKKALDNWFRDKWMQIENMSNILKSSSTGYNAEKDELEHYLLQYEDFCELFILDSKGMSIV